MDSIHSLVHSFIHSMPQRNSVLVSSFLGRRIISIVSIVCTALFFLFLFWNRMVRLPDVVCRYTRVTAIHGRCVCLYQQYGSFGASEGAKNRRVVHAAMQNQPRQAQASEKKKPRRGKNELPIRPPWCGVCVFLFLSMCGRNSAIV